MAHKPPQIVSRDVKSYKSQEGAGRGVLFGSGLLYSSHLLIGHRSGGSSKTHETLLKREIPSLLRLGCGVGSNALRKAPGGTESVITQISF